MANVERVVERYKAASRLQMGPGVFDPRATEALSKVTLRAKYNHDLNGAVISAGYYAKKLNRDMFVYSGNSFGHAVWRVSYKPGDFLDPINNTGSFIISVTPELRVSKHDVGRSKTAEIVKEKGEFCVRSPNNKEWSGGCYPTEDEAEDRLKQVEFFKRKK